MKDGIGIRATDSGSIAFDFPAVGKTIEMEIEQAASFAASIGEVCCIAAEQKGMALIIDSTGQPKLVHESVISAIEGGMTVVLGGEVLRASSVAETPPTASQEAAEDGPRTQEP